MSYRRVLQGPRVFRRSFAAVESRLDTFFSGVWWWRARRALAEKHLSQVLERFGDKSVAARRATERYREMQLAVTYWRSAPALVRRVVLAARKAGLPVSDLRLIVLNTDLRVRRNKLLLRRSTLMRALSAAFSTIVCVHWVLMYCFVALAPGAVCLKVLVIMGVFAIYAAMYRGWSLYAYRALAAIDRSGNELDHIIAATPSGAAAIPLPIVRD